MYSRDKVELHLRGGFNLPKTDWSTMFSTCQFEYGILNMLNDNLFLTLLTDITRSTEGMPDKIVSADSSAIYENA